MSKIIETPVLETKRLILRPLQLEDAPALQKYFNNWNIIKDLNDKVPWPFPEGGVEEHIKNETLPRMAQSKGSAWAILLKEKQSDPIGRVDLFYEIDKTRESHRGFWLAEPYWGQGLMSEAVHVVNDYAFDIVGMQKMRLDNYIDNPGSHRIKEKTGATLIRTEKQKWRGQDRDMEIWELTAENWKKFKQQ